MKRSVRMDRCKYGKRRTQWRASSRRRSHRYGGATLLSYFPVGSTVSPKTAGLRVPYEASMVIDPGVAPVV